MPVVDVESSSRFFKGFDHSIVEPWTQLLDRLICTIGPGAVCQQRDGEFSIGVDPERRAGVAEMAVGTWTKIFAGLGWMGWGVPAECARTAGGKVAASELGNRFRAEDRKSASEHGMREICYVFGCGE